MPVAALIGLALSLAQQAPADPGRPLADRIEVAFRACALQLTQRDYLAPKHATELSGVGINLSTKPPPMVSAMAGRLFGNDGIYASVTAPAAEMWIAASPTVPACKVTVADSDLSLSARVDWSNKLRSMAGWTFDRSRSGTQGNFMRDFFVLNAARPGPHMVLLLDGPNIVAQNSQGIQLIMTVAFDVAKAP
ncbi:hypothetical protein [uncultured Sphingomonas sp.]|uniref:hypothetical protein n=1 Tax=uncultured Sphingomonas sp. TaxID=158754 RepID=UPI0035CC5905